MIKKIAYLSTGAVSAYYLLIAKLAGATTFSTTSLGTSIDTVSGSAYEYFTVLIEKFWPFLLAAVILVGVIAFGKRIVHSLFGK